MKKILSNLLLVFTFPFKALRKSKIDNFVGGLIFGAIFSLVVNIFTVQIQEIIQKQRILEAIENEIATNLIRSNNIITINNENSKKNIPLNFFYVAPKYSSDLWSQSSEPLQYVAQLDPKVQGAISVYYSITVSGTNDMVNKTNEMLNRRTDLCYSAETDTIKEDKTCLGLSNIAREMETMGAELISVQSLELLKIFHPTQDRLNSKFIRLMMGSKSMKILSGE